MELITKLDDKKLFPNTPICEQRITTMPSYPEWKLGFAKPGMHQPQAGMRLIS